MNRTVLWSALDGVATMNSACDGMSLSKREFKILQDVRVSARGIKTRLPYAKIAITGPSGALRGSATVRLNGKVYRFAAYESAGVTDVWISTGVTFAKITAAAGIYGDTRLTTPGTATVTGRSTNNATFAADPNWVTGMMAGSTTTVASNLTSGTTYFLNRSSGTSYSFHTNLEDAIAGTNKVTLTAGVIGMTIVPELTNCVSFQVVRETATGDPGGGAMYGVSGRDLVVISDGAKVIVYDVAATFVSDPSDRTAKHITAWHPGRSKVRQEFGFDQFLVMTTANVTPSDNDAGTVTVDNGAHPDTSGTTPSTQITTGVSVDGSDWSKLAFATGDEVVSGNQFHILYDCPADRYLWDKLKVQVSNDDSTYYTVYTPGTDKAPILTPADRGFTLASFALDAAAVPAATTVKYVKFTWTFTSAPGTALNIYWLGIYGGGSIPGGTLFRTSYYNSGSRAESIGVDCDDRLGRSTAFMGCQDQRNYVVIPGNTLVNYSYFVKFQSSSSGNLATGLNYFLLYARAPGSKVFLYVQSQVIAQYSAGWAFTTVGGVSQTALGDNTLTVTSLTYYARKAPDGANMPIPPFKCVSSVGGRLYCGNCLSQNASASDTSADVYISWQDFPFRFRDTIAETEQGVFDPSSGTRVVVPGETVRQLAALVGDFVGVGSMLVWTDQSLFKVEGSDALQLSRVQRLLPYGTDSPWSVAVWHNRAAWLDQTLQVRVFGPGVYEVPTKDRMDNITTAIPKYRVSWAAGIVHKESYRLAYTIASGASNTVNILYDFLYDSWVRDAPALTPSVQFGRWEVWSGDLYSFTENGLLYKCDDSSNTQDTDLSTPVGIVPYFQLRDISDGGDHQFQFKRIGVMCDSASAKTLDAYWTDKNGVIGYYAGTSTPSIDIGSGTVSWKWNTAAGGLEAPCAFATVKGVTGTGVPAGIQFYAFVAEVQEVSGDKLG